MAKVIVKTENESPRKKVNPLQTVLAKITKPKKKNAQNVTKVTRNIISETQKSLKSELKKETKTNTKTNTLSARALFKKVATKTGLAKTTKTSKTPTPENAVLPECFAKDNVESNKKSENSPASKTNKSVKEKEKKSSQSEVNSEADKLDTGQTLVSDVNVETNASSGNSSTESQLTPKKLKSKKINLPTCSSPKTPSPVKANAKKKMNSPRCSPSKSSQTKLVKIKNLSSQEDIKEIKTVSRRTSKGKGDIASPAQSPATSRSRNNSLSDTTSSRSQSKGKSPKNVSVSSTDAKTDLFVTKNCQDTGSGIQKGDAKLASRSPKKPKKEFYKNQHNIGRRSAGRVCSYKESEVAVLFPDDYQWTAVKPVPRKSLKKGNSTSSTESEFDCDYSEITFPKVETTTKVTKKQNFSKPAAIKETGKKSDVDVKPKPNSSNKLEKDNQKASTKIASPKVKAKVKKQIKVEASSGSEGESTNEKQKPPRKEEPLKRKKSPAKGRKSKYEDIRPRAPRIQRTACLIANAINSLLYESSTNTTTNDKVSLSDSKLLKQEVKEQPADDSRKTKVDKKKKGTVDNVTSKSTKDDKKEMKEDAAPKTKVKEEKKTKIKRAVKRKAELPSFEFFTPPKRMASLNAQAIMAACKELDEAKPEKVIKSPKETTPKERKPRGRGDQQDLPKSTNIDNVSSNIGSHTGNDPPTVRFVDKGKSRRLSDEMQKLSVDAQQPVNIRTSKEMCSPGEQYINVVDDIESGPIGPRPDEIQVVDSSSNRVDNSERIANTNMRTVSNSHPVHMTGGASSKGTSFPQVIRPIATTLKPKAQFPANIQYQAPVPQPPFAHGSGGFRPMFPTQGPVSSAVSQAMSQTPYGNSPSGPQFHSATGLDAGPSAHMFSRHFSPFKQVIHPPAVQNVPAYPPSMLPFSGKASNFVDLTKRSTPSNSLPVQQLESSASLSSGVGTTLVHSQAQTYSMVGASTQRGSTVQSGYHPLRTGPAVTSANFAAVSSSMTPSATATFMPSGVNLQGYTGSASTGYPPMVDYAPRGTFPTGPAHQGAFVNTGYQILPAGSQRTAAANASVSQASQGAGQLVQGQPQNLYMYGYYQPAGPLIQAVGAASPFIAMNLPQSHVQPFSTKPSVVAHAQPLYAVDTSTNIAANRSSNTLNSSGSHNDKRQAIAPKPTDVDSISPTSGRNKVSPSSYQQISPGKQNHTVSQPNLAPIVLDLTKDTTDARHSSHALSKPELKSPLRMIKDKDSKMRNASPPKETKDIMDLDSKKVKVHTGAVGEMERHSPIKVPRGLKTTTGGSGAKKARVESLSSKSQRSIKPEKPGDTMQKNVTPVQHNIQSSQPLSSAICATQSVSSQPTWPLTVPVAQSFSKHAPLPMQTNSSNQKPPSTFPGFYTALTASQFSPVKNIVSTTPNVTSTSIETSISTMSSSQQTKSVAHMAPSVAIVTAMTTLGTSHSASKDVKGTTIPAAQGTMLGFASHGLFPYTHMQQMAEIRPIMPSLFGGHHLQIPSMPRYQNKPVAVARPTVPANVVHVPISQPSATTSKPSGGQQRKRPSPSSERSSQKSDSKGDTPATKKAAVERDDTENLSVSKGATSESSDNGKIETKVAPKKVGPDGSDNEPVEARSKIVLTVTPGSEKKTKKESAKPPKALDITSTLVETNTKPVKSPRQTSEPKKIRPDIPKTKSVTKADTPKASRSDSPRQRSDTKSKKEDILKSASTPAKTPSGSVKSPGVSGKTSSPKPSPMASKGTSGSSLLKRVTPGKGSPLLTSSGKQSSSQKATSSGGKKERRRSLDERKLSSGNASRKRLQSAPQHSPPSCWQWDGQSELKAIHGDSSATQRKCYPAIRHSDGDVIKVRDCVLVKSGSRKKDIPFVAKIAALWDRNGEMMMNILWYYRPEQTDTDRLPKTEENEIFASRHRDVVPVACIDDKAYVLTFSNFCRYKTEQKRLREGLPPRADIVPNPEDGSDSVPPLNAPTESVFLCRRVYDVKLHRFLKNPHINLCPSPVSGNKLLATSCIAKSLSPKTSFANQLDLPLTSFRGRSSTSTTLPSPLSPDVGVFVLHSANLPSFLPPGHVELLKHDSAATSLTGLSEVDSTDMAESSLKKDKDRTVEKTTVSNGKTSSNVIERGSQSEKQQELVKPHDTSEKVQGTIDVRLSDTDITKQSVQSEVKETDGPLIIADNCDNDTVEQTAPMEVDISDESLVIDEKSAALNVEKREIEVDNPCSANIEKQETSKIVHDNNSPIQIESNDTNTGTSEVANAEACESKSHMLVNIHVSTNIDSPETKNSVSVAAHTPTIDCDGSSLAQIRTSKTNMDKEMQDASDISSDLSSNLQVDKANGIENIGVVTEPNLVPTESVTTAKEVTKMPQNTSTEEVTAIPQTTSTLNESENDREKDLQTSERSSFAINTEETISTYQFVAKKALEPKVADCLGSAKNMEVRLQARIDTISNSDAKLSVVKDKIRKDPSNIYIVNNETDVETENDDVQSQDVENPIADQQEKEEQPKENEANKIHEEKSDGDESDIDVKKSTESNQHVLTQSFEATSTDNKIGESDQSIFMVQSSITNKTVFVTFPCSPRKSVNFVSGVDKPLVTSSPVRHNLSNFLATSLKSPRKQIIHVSDDLDNSVDSDRTILMDENDVEGDATETSLFEALNTSSSTDDSECRDGDIEPEPIITDMTIVEDGSGRVVTAQGEGHLRVTSEGAFAQIQNRDGIICTPVGPRRPSYDSMLSQKSIQDNKKQSEKINTNASKVPTITSTATQKIETFSATSSFEMAKSAIAVSTISSTVTGNSALQRRTSHEEISSGSSQFDSVIAKLNSLSEGVSSQSSTVSTIGLRSSNLVEPPRVSRLFQTSSSTKLEGLPPFETLRTIGMKRDMVATTKTVDVMSSMPPRPIGGISFSSSQSTLEADKIPDGLKEIVQSIDAPSHAFGTPREATKTSIPRSTQQSPDSTVKLLDSTTTTASDTLVTSSMDCGT